MAKTKAQIEFQAVTSGFNSGIKEMDNSLGTLRKELNLNSTQLKENADDVDLLGERKRILQDESDATAKKIELLKNKLAEAERLFGSSSDEVRLLGNKILDTQTAFQKIQNEITQTDTKLNNLESGLSETTQELKNTDKATDQLTDGFGATEVAIGSLVANGIQELSSSLKDLVVDSDTAYSNFQAQTGLSAEAMGELEGAIEDIYSKNFGDSINDIANAMAEVKQQTQETDPSNLQKMTENALALRDTFDMDVKESIRAVNMLMNQFGLDSTQAFNLVVQGAQSGLNKNGDLLDSINEYGVHYAQMGVSAEGFFNSLINGADSGAFSVDKLGDAYKEFGIRVKDNSDSTKQAFKDLGLDSKKLTEEFNAGGEQAKNATDQVVQKLFSLDDQVKKNEIGVALFGTMWEDLGEDTIKSLMTVQGGFDSTEQSMEELTQVKMDNITSQLGEIGRMIQTDFIIPICEDLLPILKDGLTWIKDNLNWLLPVITGIGVALATYFVVSKFMSFIGVITQIINLVKTGTTVFGALNTVMALNPITLIVAAVVGLIAVFVLLWNKCDGFREFWIGLWEGIKSIFSSVIEGVKTGFQTFMDFLGTIGEWINTNVIQPVIGFFQGLLDGVKAVWDGIVFAITFVFNLIVTIITTYFQLITLPFRFIWENCKETIMTVFNAIKNFISTIFNAIKNTITTIINAIKNVISNVFNAIKNVVTTIWNSIKDVISTVWNAIQNAISSVVNTIKTIISNVFNTIKSVATNIWNGIKNVIINPIKNAYNTIKTTVGNIKDNIINTFNNVKSKVTSVFNAIKSAIEKPINKARDLVKSAIDKIKGFFDFEFKWPKLKMPKFGIKPEGWKVGDLLEGKIPKLSITWNKEGAIFDKPTIFNTRYGLQGVAEAGPEAILPIEKLENWMNNGFNGVVANNTYNSEKIDRLIEVAEDILSKPTDIYMDKTKVGEAMGETNDNISGQRVSYKNRGVLI